MLDREKPGMDGLNGIAGKCEKCGKDAWQVLCDLPLLPAIAMFLPKLCAACNKPGKVVVGCGLSYDTPKAVLP